MRSDLIRVRSLAAEEERGRAVYYVNGCVIRSPALMPS